MKEERTKSAVFWVDGNLPPSLGHRNAEVYTTADGAVGLNYCCAGDGSASDDYYSQHHLSVIDYGARRPGDAKGVDLRHAQHDGRAEDGHRRHQQRHCGRAQDASRCQ